MDMRTFMLIDQANRCGKFDCLKNCCTPDSLLTIWRLMHQVTESQLGELGDMLCGCAVPGKAQAQGQSGNSATPLIPGTDQMATGTCADALTEWACESSHIAILNGLDTALTAAAVYTKSSPLIATIVATLSIFISDMIASCRDGQPSWTTTFITKACGLNAWIDKALGKGSEVGPIQTLLQAIKDNLTLPGLILNRCCSTAPASTDGWPDLGSVTTNYVSPPQTTSTIRYR